MKRIAFLSVMFFCVAALVTAESEYSRTLFSRENRLPEAGKLELGVFSQYTRYDESVGVPGLNLKRKDYTVSPYARYGLREDLAVFAHIPFAHVDSDSLPKSHTGIKDISVGLELLAYEYTFGYPYVLPYVEIFFPTGDEDDLMGNGKTDAAIGVSVGTTVYDVYHYVLDACYNVNQKESGTDKKNGVFSLSAAFIWDLSEKFSVMAEARGTTEDILGESAVPVYFRGGMYYRMTDKLALSWYGGTSINAPEDGMGAFQVGYMF